MAEVELGRLGERARQRPEPTLEGSIAAAGAALMVVGATAVAADVAADGGSNLPGVGLGIFALVAGYFVLVRLPAEVRPGGLAAIALGTPVAIGFLLEENLDSTSLVLFLLAVAWGVEYLVPPTRGELVFLVGTLGALWLLLLDFASDDSGSGEAVVTFDAVPADNFLGPDDTVTILSLFVGVGLLAAAWALDRDGWRGIATGCVIVGDVAFVFGVFGVVGNLDSDVVGSLLVLAAGGAMAFVGASGERRFTTWLGGLGVLIGLGALIATIFDQADAAQFGFSAMAVGVAVVAALAFFELPGSSEPEPTTTEPGPTTTEPEPGETVATPPGWHPDPHGRHQLRWWDGTTWTDQVSDNGATGTDAEG